jgi:hypothetical protein
MNIDLRKQVSRHERKLTLVRADIDEGLRRQALDCLDTLDGWHYASGERRPERRLDRRSQIFYVPIDERS